MHVSAVNGRAGDVGQEIMLLSGATLTLFADGSYIYDPNTITFLKDIKTGTFHDTFSYTASDGHGDTSTALVDITVNVDGKNNKDDNDDDDHHDDCHHCHQDNHNWRNDHNDRHVDHHHDRGGGNGGWNSVVWDRSPQHDVFGENGNNSQGSNGHGSNNNHSLHSDWQGSSGNAQLAMAHLEHHEQQHNVH